MVFSILSEQPYADRPIRVGISSCLLGEKVRFDGGHKRDSFLADTFGPFVEWVPVCPEPELIIPSSPRNGRFRRLSV